MSKHKRSIPHINKYAGKTAPKPPLSQATKRRLRGGQERRDQERAARESNRVLDTIDPDWSDTFK